MTDPHRSPLWPRALTVALTLASAATLGAGCLAKADLVEPAPPANLAPLPVETLWISIDANPWAEVYLDGTLLGRTPIRNQPVAAGTHSLRLVNEELDIDYHTKKKFESTPFDNVLRLSYQLSPEKSRQTSMRTP